MECNNTKVEIFENINGRQICLSCSQIGKLAGGCHITLTFPDDQKETLLFIGFIPLIVSLVLKYIIHLSTIFHIASFLLFLIILYSETFKIRSEKVSLIPHIGLQYSVEYKRGTNKDIFIQWENIDSFIINEVIDRQKIIYLVTVIAKDQQSNELSLVPLFRTTQPRLKCLEEIYRKLQTVLEKYNNHKF